MNKNKVKLSTDGQAVVFFDDAANSLRTYFEREVLGALPDFFARHALEIELEALSDLPSEDDFPPLAEITLMRAEQCAHDLLSMNYDGPASAFFRQCVREAALNIKAAVIAASSEGGKIVVFPKAARRAQIGRTL